MTTLTTTVKLRGNTFLTLLLRAGVQELNSRPEWGENNDGITRANMFADLLRMAQPAYNPPRMKTLSSYFSQYLSGDKPISPTYFDFETPGFRHGLDARINNDYQSVLAEMDNFCRRYLRKADIDRQQLVGGIVDAILQDKKFNGRFDLGEKSVDRTALNDQTHFVLQPFLLSVWNEILKNYPDTSEGQETYMDWTEDAGDSKPRKITTQIGSERAKKITVSDEISGGLILKPINEAVIEDKEQRKNSEQTAQTAQATADATADTTAATGSTGAVQQTVNKEGRVYNQNAEKIFNIEHIENFNA